MKSERKNKNLKKEIIKLYLKNISRPLRIIAGDPLALTGVFILLFLTMVGIFAPFLALYDPNETHIKTEGVVFSFEESLFRDEWISDLPLNEIKIIEDKPYTVGDGGFMASREKGTWTTWELTTEEDLFGLSFLRGEFGVVAGSGGTLLMYENGEWRKEDTGFTGTFYDVQLVRENFGLAVGQEGTIYKWDGTNWEQVSSPTPNDLHGVALLDQDNGFIVGSRGTILKWENGNLSPEMVMTIRDFFDIDIISSGFAAAVGERGTIFFYNGQRWSEQYGPETRELRSVIIRDENDIYVAGRFGISLNYDGLRWDRVDNPYRRHFRSLALFEDKLMVVGTDPYVNELASPTWAHPFGTTHIGRDVFSQVVFGTRTALFIGFVTALFVSIVGVNVGLLAGYFKGLLDDLLMRFVDIMYALPFEPFAMILVLVFEPSLWIVFLSIGLLTWRTNARIIRSQVLSLSERPFVKAAKVVGANNARIIYLHIAPNILPLAFLQLAVAMGWAITAEATLSFLGLGPPRIYSWGTILHAARLSGAWRTAWWWIIPPGVLIMLTVSSVFFLSRSLEVLTNPRLEGEIEDARD